MRISIAIGMTTKQDLEILLENSGSVCPKICNGFKFYMLSAAISISCYTFLIKIRLAVSAVQ